MSTLSRRDLLTAVVTAGLPLAGAPAERFLLFIGTRDLATPRGRGIYSCFCDSATGTCGPVSLAAELVFPSFLAVSPDRQHIYAVSEIGYDGGRSPGNLFALAVNRPSGSLKLLNQVSAGGVGPTSMAIDRTGSIAVVANYGATVNNSGPLAPNVDNGRTTAFRVLPDGRLGEPTASIAHTGSGPHPRQTAPHAHCVAFSPDNRLVFVPDLGADRVVMYRFDSATGVLQPSDPPFFSLPPGSGPRQLLFHPGGRFAYVMSELVATMTVFGWDAEKSRISKIQTVSVVAAGDTNPPSGSGIAMHPGGRFLFTTTRNDNSIEVFSIDPQKGTLTLRQRVPSRGMTPWNIAIDPAGGHLFVTNWATDAVGIFRIDAGTGDLTAIEPLLSVPRPISAVFVPA